MLWIFWTVAIMSIQMRSPELSYRISCGSIPQNAAATVALQILKEALSEVFCLWTMFLRRKLLTTNCEEPVILLNRESWEREFKPVKAEISHHYHDRGDGRIHSHLPPGADGSFITWESLLALGVSGGLLPCPSALVMLLSASALGNVGLGMTRVVAFSLGLALVLSAIGLILVDAKRNFDKLPEQITALKFLPAISAMFVMFLGLGITGQAMFKILGATQ